MTRRKNHRRTRRKQEVQEPLDQSSKDLSYFVTNKSDADIENDNLESTLKMDSDTTDPNLRTPETVMLNSQTPIDPMHCKDLSPRIVGKIPKIKLDLDIPDCDPEPILKIESASLDITLENVDSKKRSSVDNFYKLENPQIEAVDADLNDYLLDKTVSIDNAMKIELEAEAYTDWSAKYHSTANSLPRHDTSTMVFGSVNRARSEERNRHCHNFDYQQTQTVSERYDSRKNTSLGPKSQRNDAINRRFTFEGMQKPEYRVTDETVLTEDASWHGVNRTFSNMEQLKMIKTASEPEPLLAQKYMNQKHTSKNFHSQFGEPQSMYSGDEENTYYLTNTDMNDDMNCSRSSSPPAKRSRTALRFENETQLRTISSVIRPPVFNFSDNGAISPIENDSEYAKALKTGWSSSSCSPTSVELPTVSDLNGKTSASEIEAQVLSCDRPHPECTHFIGIVQPPVTQFHLLTIPLIKITEFCSWLAKRIVELLRKGSTWFLRTMTMNAQQKSARHPDTSILVNDLSQLVTTIRCENDHTLSILSEKVTHLSEELVQVRVHSQTTLAMLATELDGMREANNILTGQLKTLHNALDNIQSKPSLPPPPPPPPPPPSQPITPTTPNSSRSIRTPNRKCSTPLAQGRPTITVEDLLKVTLKKAPRNVKENKANTSATPRGPAVSLDMLRSVKLKSARRRSSDQIARSPRSMSLSMRSRPPPSLSLSPIMAGKDSPLGRILRQVDTNKRGAKRTLSSPTHSEAELTRDRPRTFSIARQSKSHTVML